MQKLLKRDSSAFPAKLMRKRKSKSTKKTCENSKASSDKFRLDQSDSFELEAD